MLKHLIYPDSNAGIEKIHRVFGKAGPFMGYLRTAAP